MKKLPLILGIALLVGCHKSDKNRASIDDLSGDEVIDSALIVQSKKERKLWELKAARIEFVDSTTKVYGFKLKFFGANGSVVSVLQADSGMVYEATGDMTAIGHVSVVTLDSTKLTTNTLNWDNRREKIYTDDYITIVDSSGKVLKGKGLEADPGLTHIKIKSEVKAYGTD